MPWVNCTFPSMPHKVYLIHCQYTTSHKNDMCTQGAILSSKYQYISWVFNEGDCTWYSSQYLYWEYVFNSATTHLPKLYHRISSTNDQSCIAYAKRPASNAHDFIFRTPPCVQLVVVTQAMIVRRLSPEYSGSQRCSITEYFIIFALVVYPKHTSDLAKPYIILGEGFYLSVCEEIPELHFVGTFVGISNFSLNK